MVENHANSMCSLHSTFMNHTWPSIQSLPTLGVANMHLCNASCYFMYDKRTFYVAFMFVHNVNINECPQHSTAWHCTAAALQCERHLTAAQRGQHNLCAWDKTEFAGKWLNQKLMKIRNLQTSLTEYTAVVQRVLQAVYCVKHLWNKRALYLWRMVKMVRTQMPNWWGDYKVECEKTNHEVDYRK